MTLTSLLVVLGTVVIVGMPRDVTPILPFGASDVISSQVYIRCFAVYITVGSTFES